MKIYRFDKPAVPTIAICTLLAFSGPAALSAEVREKDRAPGEKGARWTQETERLIEKSKTVSNLDRQTVRNEEGKRLGRLSDLVIKLPDGEITHAVVSSGGLFGIGADEKLVPYDMLTHVEDKDEFRLDISKDLWDQAPTLDRDQRDQLESDGFWDQVTEWFRADSPRRERVEVERTEAPRAQRRAAGMDQQTTTSAQRERRQVQTQAEGEPRQEQMQAEAERGRERLERERDRARDRLQRERERGEERLQTARDPAFGDANHYLSSDVMGYNVIDAKGENIGRVSDFVLDHEENKITHVVLSIGGFMGVGDDKFAVPPDELEINRKEGKIHLGVSKRAFTDERTDEDEGWFEGVFNR